MRKKTIRQRALSILLSLAMVFSLMSAAAFAVPAANAPSEKQESYPFGTAGTLLAPGRYDIPVSLMNAGKPNQPSMAKTAIKGGQLEVMENGDGYVTVQLGPVTVGVLTGWSSRWEIYNEKDYTAVHETSVPTAAEVTRKDAEGHDAEICFKLPYTDRDGVYCRLFVALMGLNPDAYLALDFAGIDSTPGPEPEKPADTKTAETPVVLPGSGEAYTVQVEITVTEEKISGIKLTHNAAEKHPGSLSFAEKAAAGMKDKFIGVSAKDPSAIEALDTVSGATITSGAYKEAVLKALGLYQPPRPADFTFGSANAELQPGTYKVPLALRNASKHGEPSNAAGAFPAMGLLTVAENGTATLTTDFRSVTIGPVTDMAYDVKIYQENSFGTGTPTVDATILGDMVKPEPMPGAGKKVPTRLKIEIPNNDWDGIYLNFTVDAMGPASPDAWLSIDYASARVPGDVVTREGKAQVDQFGKYTIFTRVSMQDGEIVKVDIRADNFISETHRPTNEMKIAQVTKALSSAWNGMAPTQENAEKIFKVIMNPQSPDDVIDSVSGATYSAKAVRDAVMNACGLSYQDEIIHVPEKVEPGVYEVEIGYYSDVVWHSLVEDVKAKAILTVNVDGTMSLAIDTKSGTEKEPLYILGFNGVYPNNDRTATLTMDGCRYTMDLTPNDYEDENFAKGTKVVNHVEFPLLGGLSETYTTNCCLYVPAMKRLNGELSGVFFENGKFDVDVFAKIYWDGMKKIGGVSQGTVSIEDLGAGGVGRRARINTTDPTGYFLLQITSAEGKNSITAVDVRNTENGSMEISWEKGGRLTVWQSVGKPDMSLPDPNAGGALLGSAVVS